jgi:hypothetical protein
LGQGFFVRDQHRRYYFVGCHIEQAKRVEKTRLTRKEWN